MHSFAVAPRRTGWRFQSRRDLLATDRRALSGIGRSFFFPLLLAGLLDSPDPPTIPDRRMRIVLVRGASRWRVVGRTRVLWGGEHRRPVIEWICLRDGVMIFVPACTSGRRDDLSSATGHRGPVSRDIGLASVGRRESRQPDGTGLLSLFWVQKI